MSLGFTLDLKSCIGCKACQVACMDKHGLEPDRLWRRVVEVSGGGWVRRGSNWYDASVAWYVSVSCMHCARPICVEVCPTKAMHKQENGIVAVDESRCMGCGYCAWACPYRAPRLDEARGVMTKCDLCRDLLEAGRDPACVAACPMRVLGVADVDEEHDGLDEVFPLPDAKYTEPTTSLAPHPDVERADPASTRIANEEEIR